MGLIPPFAHRGVAKITSLVFVKHSDTVVRSTIDKPMNKLIILSSEECLNSVQ